jgi:hypothetical protein
MDLKQPQPSAEQRPEQKQTGRNDNRTPMRSLAGESWVRERARPMFA